jgi:DNA polymerase-3 subunit epsilon
MGRIAVIDFETTGMSPDFGDRPTEVAIVLVEDGRIVDRYQSLMNAGVRVSSFITQLTGITNAMVASAPPVAQVMREASRFVDGLPMAAHNASFDRKFWMDEMRLLDLPADHAFACTMLLARRLYPQAPNHKLGTLVDFHGLPRTGAAHRALADAEMAAELLIRMHQDLQRVHGVREVAHGLLVELQSCQRAAVPGWLSRCARAEAP